MSREFAVTFDYRCPFARNAHEHVITGLESGADWKVRFSAFSLDQAHVDEGQPAVWEVPDRHPGLTANLAGIVVRDRHPEKFLSVHRALFAARHDDALDLRERDILTKILDGAGLEAAAVLAEIDSGWPLEVLREEHTEAVDGYQVFGVPTFISGERAVFVRLLDRPEDDAERATTSVDRVLDLLTGWPDLNEFKHTSLTR
jgi:hypothetical protein